MRTKPNSKLIFIVEDDVIYGKMLKYLTELNPDYTVHWFKKGKECLEKLHLQPQIVLLDYSLPDMSGKEVLEKIKRINNQVGVIVISGQQDIATAVELLQMGAYDYVIKNEEIKERLPHIIQKLFHNQQLTAEVETLKEELGQKFQIETSLIGQSESMQGVYLLLQKAAKSNITVSITGETGTGKEVVAKTIHYNSEQKKGAFVAINMAAIPAELIESELFGYEKGAFTGAVNRKIGKLEEAHNGTLFLDEIAEMDLKLQAKILRVLQEREFVRVGGTKTISFDCRLIVATHRNLLELVKMGKFREDLYYRLLGLPIHLPPLRERGNDILLLADHFIREFARSNRQNPPALSREAKEKLLRYPFAGNVRELRALIELASVLCDNGIIDDKDLKLQKASAASPHQSKFISISETEEMTLRDYEWKIIQTYLQKYNNDVLTVADKLGVGKSTIYRIIKAHQN